MQRFKNTVILFGGRKPGINAAFATGIYLLKLDTLTWTRLQQTSYTPNQPLPLTVSDFAHALVKSPSPNYSEYQDNSQHLLIFGGINQHFQMSNKIIKIEFFKEK